MHVQSRKKSCKDMLGLVLLRIEFFFSLAQRRDRNGLDLKLETELRELNGTRKKAKLRGKTESKK